MPNTKKLNVIERTLSDILELQVNIDRLQKEQMKHKYYLLNLYYDLGADCDYREDDQCIQKAEAGKCISNSCSYTSLSYYREHKDTMFRSKQ